MNKKNYFLCLYIVYWNLNFSKITRMRKYAGSKRKLYNASGSGGRVGTAARYKRRRVSRSKKSFKKSYRGSNKTSKFVYRSKSSKKTRYTARIMKAISAQNTLMSNGAIRIVAGSSQQAFSHQGWCYGAQLGSANGCSLTEWFSGVGSSAINSRAYLQKTSMDYRMINNTTNQIFVTIYDLISRTDVPYDNSQNQPTICWQASVADTGSTMLTTDIGCTPYMGGRFGEYYKILRTRKLIMNPGEAHRHYVRTNENRFIPRYKWIGNSSSNDLVNIAGLTKHTLFVVSGGTANEAGITATVGTSIAALDITWQMVAKVLWCEDRLKNTTLLTNALNPLNILGTAAVVNDDDGNVMNVAIA